MYLALRVVSKMRMGGLKITILSLNMNDRDDTSFFTFIKKPDEPVFRTTTMAKLSEHWLTEHLMDFEYKKYILLGYLKQVKEHFNEQKLYPDFSELISHYKNLIQIKRNTEALENNFKKSLKAIDYKNLKLVYESPFNKDSLDELKQIIEFSEPLLAQELQEGKTIFDLAEKNIFTDHIGILPIYKQEGYMMLYPHQSHTLVVYNYRLEKVSLLQQEVYGLSCSYFSTYTITLSTPVDKIKQEIIQDNPQLPNPAVYLFQSTIPLPNEETFLPVAKRLLYKHLVNSTHE